MRPAPEMPSTFGLRGAIIPPLGAYFHRGVKRPGHILNSDRAATQSTFLPYGNIFVIASFIPVDL